MFADCTIIFDLDGTLIDTAPDLTRALNHVLESQRRAPLPEAEVRRLVGQGALVLITRGMAATGAPATEEALPDLLARFLDFYGENIAISSVPFPGVVETLDELAQNRARLGVCTNKPIGLTRPLFDALDMTRFFPAILGGDSLDVRKPDPKHLLETVRIAGGDPARSVMVGDSAADVDAAKAAGIPVVAVTFGYSATPVDRLGADIVIDQFEDLRNILPPLLGI